MLEQPKPVCAGRKTWFHTLLAFMLLTLFAAGCGNPGSQGSAGGGNDEPGDADAGKSGEAVTIDFWVWGGDFQKQYKKVVIDEFEKKHPNIKVKIMNDEGTEKLITYIAGGKAPDVAILDRFLVGSFAAKGSLEDLTPYAQTDKISASDYYPGVWAEANYNGKLYALPWGTDDRAMYYNKTLMKEAGLDPDKPPQTIQELDQMAEKMFKKATNGKYEQVGFIPWMNQGFFYTQAWNWGGKWEQNGELTPNDPQNVKALQWMADYTKKYGLNNINDFFKTMGQTGMNPFWTGKVGFVFDGNWILNDLPKVKPKFEWGVAPMPSADGYPQTTWSGGFSFVMPKGAKHPKEAWELIKFIAGYDGTLLWAKRPTATNVDITAMPAVNEALKLGDNPQLKVFLDLMPKALFRPVTPVGQKMWDETFRVQGLALEGKGEPQKLLDEVKKIVDAELAKIQK